MPVWSTLFPNKSVKYEFLSPTSRNPHQVWNFRHVCCINSWSSWLRMILAQSSKWQEISNRIFPILIYEFNVYLFFQKKGEVVIGKVEGGVLVRRNKVYRLIKKAMINWVNTQKANVNYCIFVVFFCHAGWMISCFKSETFSISTLPLSDTRLACCLFQRCDAEPSTSNPQSGCHGKTCLHKLWRYQRWKGSNLLFLLWNKII